MGWQPLRKRYANIPFLASVLVDILSILGGYLK